MHATILLSIILCFKSLLCSSANFLDLCKRGSAVEVISALKASSADTEVLHSQAQLCFDVAVEGYNLGVLEALPEKYPIDPNHLLDGKFRHDMAQILLKSNWTINGTKVSGKELVTTHVNLLTIQSPDDLYYIFAAGAMLGYLDVVKTLVEVAHVDYRANYNLALFMAAENGHYHIVRYILRRSPTDMVWLNNVFLWACESGDSVTDYLPLVRILCEEFKVDPTLNAGDIIIKTVTSGRVDLLEYLISRGLDLNVKIDEVLVKACYFGHLAMVRFLLQCPGVNPVVYDNKALRKASDMNRQSILNVLLHDSRVLASLTSWHVEYILSRRCSGEVKLILLNWMALNMMAPIDMRWIPVYKKFMLTRPQFAAQFQAVKDTAVDGLRNMGFHHIANFIEAWAEALRKYSFMTSGQDTSSQEFADVLETFLSAALSSAL